MKTTQQCFLELSYTVTWKPWKVFGMLELKSEMLYYRGAVWQSMAWSDDFNGWKFDKQGFPGGTMLKHPPANAGGARYAGSIPGSGRSPGVDNGNPQQHFCLENSMDRGPWQATVHGVTKSRIQLNNWACKHGGFIPSFLRDCHTVLHSGCINLHSFPHRKVLNFTKFLW